jgi:hypothetical protein
MASSLITALAVTTPSTDASPDPVTDSERGGPEQGDAVLLIEGWSVAVAETHATESDR